MRAIITGATGMIGVALVQELVDSGAEVLVLCREGSARNENIPVHPSVTMRYCDLDHLHQLGNDTGKDYDVFFHLAWAGTKGNDRQNAQIQQKNIANSLSAVDAAKRFGCRIWIGAGSQAEYGRHEGTLRADTPCFPENAYGIAKLCAGQLTRLYAHQLGMEHVWVRILSVYGAYDGPQTMIMSLIRSLRSGETPRLTKGEQMWDYLYCDDAARAFRLIGEKGRDGKTYVLGSGQAQPLIEYMKIVRDLTAPKAALDVGGIPYAEKQVMYLCADINELTKDTGWKPRVEFKDGIEKTIGFYPGGGIQR